MIIYSIQFTLPGKQRQLLEFSTVLSEDLGRILPSSFVRETKNELKIVEKDY